MSIADMEVERTYIKLTADEFINIWKREFLNAKKEDGKGYYRDIYGKGELVAVFDGIELEYDQSIFINGDKNTINNFTRTLPNIYIKNSRIGRLSISVQKTGMIIIINSKIISIDIYNSSTGHVGISDSEIDYCNIGTASILKSFKADTSLFRKIDVSNATVLNYNLFNSSVNDLLVSKSTIGDWDFVQSKCVNINLKAVVSGKLHIINSVFLDKFKIEENSQLYSLVVQAKDLRKLLLIDSYFQTFQWKQDTFCMLNVNSCQIALLDFQHTAIPKDSIFQFVDCQVNTFNCISFINTAWFNVSNLTPLIIYNRFADKKYDHTNELNPVFNVESNSYEKYDTNSTSKICFINSDFGKTSLVDCKLDKFDSFVFYNSKLLDIFVAGTILPVSVSLPEGLDIDEENEQKRLVFGQFKKIYESRGDIISAADYLVLELDAYSSQLKEKKFISQRGDTHSERFILYLNKISNNHGTDWWRAVWVTLLVNSVLFFVYCQLQGYWFGADYMKALQLSSYSFEYLNPLRKADFLDKKTIVPALVGIDWLARFWDYFSRIIVAYFVYQTIQAFRRFGKTK